MGATQIALTLIVVALVAMAGLGVAGWVTSHSLARTVRQTREEAVALRPFFERARLEAAAESEAPLAGVIVEPRRHRNLVSVIQGFRARFPDAPLYVLHGTENLDFLQAALGVAPPGVTWVSLGVANLTIRQYSFLLSQPALYRDVLRGRHLLVFQTDSVLFSRSQVRLEDYLAYDWVGAPWRPLRRHLDRAWGWLAATEGPGNAGNGGLSLRRRAKMLEVTQAVPYLSTPYLAEDLYFSHALQAVGAHLPTLEEAARLFFEYVPSAELPLGAHKYLPPGFDALITADERAVLEPPKS